jgi:heme exporter protein A
VSDGDRCDFDLVEVRGVSRHYGRRRALWRAELDCRAGEIVGLFGPNGAGKSTLLGVLSTSVRPNGGEVRYGGALASDLGERLRARIGMLGHDLFLYADLTARENLEFFGRLYGVDPVADRVDDGLEQAGLTDRADDRVGGFSRGLRQRLALERALLHAPRLVLLDEPFTGLDEASARMLQARLNGLRASGTIVVMATHDFETAEAVVDRVVCVRDGRVRPLEPAAGPIRERYRQALEERWA